MPHAPPAPYEGPCGLTGVSYPFPYPFFTETAEALFLMYRVTRDEKWREMGWTLFEVSSRCPLFLSTYHIINAGLTHAHLQNFEKQCRTEVAFSGLADVEVKADANGRGHYNDEMPSYFLAGPSPRRVRYSEVIELMPSDLCRDTQVFLAAFWACGRTGSPDTAR